MVVTALMRDDDGDRDGDLAVLGPDIKVAYWHHLHTSNFEKQRQVGPKEERDFVVT